MYFTEDDLKKIEQYLSSRGKKDTEFDIVDSLNHDDTIPIIQDGINKRIHASRVISVGNDYINITKSFGIEGNSLIDNVGQIPLQSRNPGLTITYKTGSGNWCLYQYIGETSNEEDWLDIDNWSTPAGPENFPVDNVTIGVEAGHLVVLDNAITHQKLSNEVRQDLATLQREIDELAVKEVVPVITVSSKHYYIGYSNNISITSEIDDIDADGNHVLDVSKIASLNIKNGNSVVASTENQYSLQHTLVVDGNATITSTTEFQYNNTFPIVRVSKPVSITGVQPVYIGVLPTNYTLSDIEDFINENHLFRKSDPPAVFDDVEMEFNLNNAKRMCIITQSSINKTVVESFGMEHPLITLNFVYNGTAYEALVSEYTYSDGIHKITFK